MVEEKEMEDEVVVPSIEPVGEEKEEVPMQNVNVDEFLVRYKAAWDWSLQYPNLGVYQIKDAARLPSSTVVDRLHMEIAASPKLTRNVGVQNTIHDHREEENALSQAINRLPWILEGSSSEVEVMDKRW